MKLNELADRPGATKNRMRVGRGIGSGKGKTAGRGVKGQKARTGHHGIPSWFEGGQMPLQRRVPKRGFKNPFRTVYEIVNLGQLNKLSEETITPEVLHSNRLVDIGKGNPVKILGDGEITRKVTVRAHAVSESARAKIEAAGGSVEILEP